MSLRGTRGRRGRESDRLAAEAVSMEAKLRALKQQMSQERQKWDSDKAANGGSRWRSARKDKGSIRNYSKEVRSRPSRSNGSTRKRRGEGGSSTGPVPALPLGGQGPSLTRKAKSHKRPGSGRRPMLNNADADKWTVADVKRWLNVLSLSQYQETFATNEIRGEELLELGSDDLDYMQIKVLGHRKMLLKGIDTLRRAVNGEPPLSARRKPAFKSEDVALVYDTSAKDNNVGTESKPRAGDKVHWSQAKPLSENAVENSQMPVNLADGTFDEAAQRRAFQEAVMSWRTSGKDQAQVVAKPEASLAGTGGFWTSPFAASTESTANTSGSGASPSEQEAGEEPAEGEGGALLDGTLDEAVEHLAFEKAVEAWRNGGEKTMIKGSCYQCYKLFYKERGHYIASGDKGFCSNRCREGFEAAKAAAAKAQEELESRRASLAESKDAKVVPELRKVPDEVAELQQGSRLGTPIDVEPLETPRELLTARAEPQPDYSNIWSLDVQF